MKFNKIVSAVLVLPVLGSLLFVVPALAQVNATVNANVNTHMGTSHWNGPMMREGNLPGKGQNMRPIVIGTVTSVSGNTITISGRTGFGTTTVATSIYTVDASNAKVIKNNATSSISAIVVNDNLIVQGTINGTNIVATMIRDGQIPAMPHGPIQGKGMKPGMSSTTPPIIGNGQPVIAGKVASISGSIVMIKTASNVTYTVDASNAKVVSGSNVVTLSSVTVGNSVLIQGTVNGNSVTASSIIEQNTNVNGKPAPQGLFKGIGQFFMHLFGF